MAVAEAELSVIRENNSLSPSHLEPVASDIVLNKFISEQEQNENIPNPQHLNIDAPPYNPFPNVPLTHLLPQPGLLEHHETDFHRQPLSHMENRWNNNPGPEEYPFMPPSGTAPHGRASVKDDNHSSPGVVQETMSEFARLWLKKDLITNIEPFDDQPEHYAAWKTAFKRVVSEIGVTPHEEIELLVKWLGPISSADARSIRSSHAFNAVKGCQAVWQRLEERFGAPEMVEASVKRKIDNFKMIGNRDTNALFDLSNILGEIETLKGNPVFRNLLAYYDTSSGISPIVSKLPYALQEKWTSRAFQFKRRFGVSYPPFPVFVAFIQEMSSMRNDPSFVYHPTGNKAQMSTSSSPQKQRNIAAKKTTASPIQPNLAATQDLDIDSKCPLHNTNHSLNKCEKFRKMNLDKRREFLRTNKICFKCCASTGHQSSGCSSWEPCEVCNSTYHPSAMHLYKKQLSQPNSSSTESTSDHGGEAPEVANHGGEVPEVGNMCTQLCGPTSGGRSCSKMALVKVFVNDRPQDSVTVYAILDDQSNHSLARTDLLDQLGISTAPEPYRLSSCAGVTEEAGRTARGISVQSLDGRTLHKLPPVIECNNIPQNIHEIPTPEVARAHKHLHGIADQIYPLNPEAKIQLLIGRDLPEAHLVHDQIPGSPFAQRLSLGWMIVGDVCLDGRHIPADVHACKTLIHSGGRGTIFQPCENALDVQMLTDIDQRDSGKTSFRGDDVFHTTKNDSKVGLSVDDREFLSLMDREFKKDSNGNWTAPLPFNSPQTHLPCNRLQVLKRAQNLDASLRRNPVKLQHMVEFMDKVFSSGAAERAQPLSGDKESWYLPIFGVYHPKKPGKIRGVFDSSIVYKEHSLNEALLSGPNLTNSLVGVLLRFRKDKYAVAGDIQQMFYRFFVNQCHRDYLRFFWYENNDPDRPMIEYRMKVHVFGNRPSPAVATYGLRRAVENSDEDIVNFVKRDFYVDDALTSRPTSAEAITLMKRTQDVLKTEGNIRLHKIVSNDPHVMEAFPPDDRGSEIKDLSCTDQSSLVSHSLGMAWNLASDSFIFTVPEVETSFTHRGVLSRINSIFDPMGFLSPVTVCGKLLLRQMCPSGSHWDDPISEEYYDSWLQWNDCLKNLSDLHIPRPFIPVSLSTAENPEVLIFSDASEKAIAAAAYLKLRDKNLGFIMGKSKVAPLAGHSIPRLELCGAVLATEIGEFISEHLDIPPSSIKYLTDSKVVLGYIRNRTRRFYMYVSNRVARIHSVSSPEQWSYVPTHQNPADRATRGSLPDVRVSLDIWLQGPVHLLSPTEPVLSGEKEPYILVAPDEDPEVKPEVTTLLSNTESTPRPVIERYTKFSSWDKLVGAVSTLRHVSNSFKKSSDCSGWHQCKETGAVIYRKETEHMILKQSQEQAFPRERVALSNTASLPKDSRILSLSPYMDEGLLRVKGRLNKLKDVVGLASLNPIIVPGGHIATLLICHFHEKVSHQGRGMTEAAIRSAGLWILGAKRLIANIIYHCVTCRKMRRKLEEQKMADLPIDRLSPGPPFTSVGVDVFGPWPVVTRKTRGGSAQNKRWATLFTCLTTRAVHLEVLEDMSSSCFINALRRFVALRGPVQIIRSDRGSNFVGAVDDIGVHAVNVEDTECRTYLKNSGAVWLFNAPHASHMGGVWERAIGTARRILDSMLLKEGAKELTHEVLVTLMMEVSAIMNSRPIAVVDSDSSDPLVLTPNILLTHKQGDTATLSENLGMKDMYKAQWKHVQVLSDIFWKKWRNGYLSTLQTYQKWAEPSKNIKPGDVVLLRDKGCHRNQWPIAIVERAIESDDGLVRKAIVRVAKDGKTVTYTRPVSEMVLLLE